LKSSLESLSDTVGLSITSDYEVNPEQVSDIRAAISDFIVTPAKKYPITKFYYFFNPSSMLAKAIAARSGYIELHILWIKEAVLLCSNLKNVEIYFFDNDPFTEDIGNYKDFDHYSKDINSFILKSIYSGYGRLTVNNVDEIIDLFKTRIIAYDIKAINDYIQRQTTQKAYAP
jgi:hypothetical protein